MRMERSPVLLVAMLLTACGSNTVQRAATGSLTGAAVGGVIGGPVGLVVGGAVGGAGGALMPEGADQIASNIIHNKPVMSSSSSSSQSPSVDNGENADVHSSSGSSQVTARARTSGGAANVSNSLEITPDLIRQIQLVLKDQGLYDGNVDGLMGPRTRNGLTSIEAKDGSSGGVDLATMQMLVSQGPSGGDNGSANAPEQERTPAPQQEPQPEGSSPPKQ